MKQDLDLLLVLKELTTVLRFRCLLLITSLLVGYSRILFLGIEDQERLELFGVYSPFALLF